MKNFAKAYGDCTGPLGFPMASETAAFVEQALKDMPQEYKDLVQTSIRMPDGSVQVVKGYGRRAAVTAAQDYAEDERADISFVTTDSIDRDREVLLPGGADWKQWKKNPRVTFAHRYDELPVGSGLWVHRHEAKNLKGWLAKTQYITKPDGWGGTWFPDAVWHYVKSGNLPGKSVGFIPTDMSPPGEKEIEARPELAGVRGIIRKWVVLEYAVAPIPSNPDALVESTAKAKSLGLEIPELLFEEMGLIIPDAVPTYSDLASKVEIKDVLAPDPVVTVVTIPPPKRVETLEDTIRDMDIPAIVRAEFDRQRGRA